MGSGTNTRATVIGSEEKKIQMGVPNVRPSKDGGRALCFPRPLVQTLKSREFMYE